jgi:hypothetical protein
VLALICLLNLTLTIGVIRRLREHAGLLRPADELGRAQGGGTPPEPVVGKPVGDFSVTTVDGDELDRAKLAESTLVGFFSPGCQPCAELRPAFIEYAVGLARDRVIAVINAGSGAEAAADVRALAAVAQVVVERPGAEPLSAAFGVTGYPTLCTVDGSGRITGSGRTLTGLLASTRG